MPMDAIDVIEGRVAVLDRNDVDRPTFNRVVGLDDVDVIAVRSALNGLGRHGRDAATH